MKRFALALCLSLLSGCACHQTGLLTEANQQAAQNAESIPKFIIPEVNLENASLYDAVNFLARSEEAQGKTPRTFLNRGITPRTVTIKGKAMAYSTVLNEICSQADLQWTATDDHILIHEK